MRRAMAIIMILAFAGCYSNPRTWVEWNGHQALQYHENGHGWTEKAVVTVLECDWVDLKKSPVNDMDYCPAKNRGTETALAQAFEEQSAKVLPAVIHGLAFMAGTLGGAAILGSMIPSSNITQLNTVSGSPIRTSTLLINGPVPGGVAP